MAVESQERLDEEIARLRERLEGAEEMRQAIIAEQIDGFVVGDGEERVVLLEAGDAPSRALIERLPDSIATVSRDATILYANRRFGEMVGRPLGSLFSTPMPDIVATESRATFERFLAASEVDASVRIEFVHASGDRVMARVTAMAIDKGHTSLLIDDRLAERDDAEHALRAIASGNIDGVVVGGEHVMLLADAQRPYHTLVDRMHQGAVTVSPGGDVLYANERFATMLGRPRDALLGKRLGSVFGTSAIDALLTRADAFPIEFVLVRDDQSRLPVRIVAERVDGVDALTLILEDLTERERHRALQERARRNDHFLAVLAHELRNPLGSIRNAAVILERCGVAEVGRAALGVIERQSETLVRLVDDLLDVHRLNEGKIVLQRKPVEMHVAIEDAVNAASESVAGKRQTFDVNLPDQPLHVDADPVRFAQVLANLLLNASKFTGDGGHIEVAVSHCARDGKPIAFIRVTDNGIGIAPDQLERIFEPYVQASAEASPFPEGLGLGLSVAKQLIELHGGAIRAHSEGPGRGTTFVVELPLCEPPAPTTQTAAVAPATRSHARILIADDDRDAAFTMASLLELMGHETYTAPNGEAALRLADALKPDVAILDIGMPQIDGYAAARMLRERSWSRGLLLYALTGWGDAKNRERTRDAGFDRHFVKPVSVDELLARLADDLERRGARVRDGRDP
ncbi:MAG TPA: ATP-binding protein [Casimicrobiaceae bacterium]|nr:ATP-binding protein [Casimicrobiaceae bacterium]